MDGHTRILTLKNGYHVWTRQVGTGSIPVLILHGGPGATHEYLEALADHLPLDRVRLYFYDQLGSFHSDQPADPALWHIERFRDEVNEVRAALGLERFILFGQSWGGMLAIEYALLYPEQLMGVVISNMVASVASYVRHLNELRAALPAAMQEEMAEYEAHENFTHPRYLEIMDVLYRRHLCRLEEWPAGVTRSLLRINMDVYGTMQGPNEFFVTGTFKDWDRWEDLPSIIVPTLLMVGAYDTMDPADVLEMGQRIPGAETVVCPNGSHIAMWDDPAHYFPPLEAFFDRAAEMEKTNR